MQFPTRDHLAVSINGQRMSIRGDDVLDTLAEFLRSRRRLVGTKVVCNEGDCGACSVLVGKPNAVGSEFQYAAIDACIVAMYQLDRTHIVTVEGLGEGGSLTPVQAAMVHGHASQCGFCTPGFVTTLHAMIEAKQTLCAQSLRLGLSGNLCRCTGYQQIIQAGEAIEVSDVTPLAKQYPAAPMLRSFAESPGVPVIKLPSGTICVPQTLEQAIAFRADYPNAVIVSGGTDYGVLQNHDKVTRGERLCLANVAGLDEVKLDDAMLTIGGLATWTKIEHAIKDALPEYHQIICRFGSPQIRNMGTLAGNLAGGSPIADSVPFHIALDAEIELASVRGTRRLRLADFYLGYRKTALAPDELITRLFTPLPKADERIKLFKISKRNDMDISTLTLGLWVKLAEDNIQDARIVVGGVGPVVTRLAAAEAALRGKAWCEESFRLAGQIARQQVSPWTDVRGSAEYRSLLTENLLAKCFIELAEAS